MEASTNHNELAAEVIRQAALKGAWQRAIRTLPPLALLERSGGSLHQVMADAIDTALALGVLEHEQLVEAALARIPRLRSPNGQKPQQSAGD